jgi:competence protein ComEA
MLIKLVKENSMKVTVNQRSVLLVILAMIFVLALSRGIMQSTEIEQSITNPPPIAINHQKNKLPQSKTKLDDSGLDKPLRINSASAKEIADKLEGIGEAIEQRIVLRRQKQGPFQDFEQLKSVSGVGTAKIEANKQRISFE